MYNNIVSVDPPSSRDGERTPNFAQPLASIRDLGRSVTGKLMAVVLLTTAIALLVAGISLLASDLYHDRRAWADELHSTANILALATAPALSFDDHGGADRNLAALASQPSIQAGMLYDVNGRLYAQYLRKGARGVSPLAPQFAVGLRFSGDEAELVQPILLRGERLGTLYLRAGYNVTGRILTYAGILAAVMLLGLLAALIAAVWLQRVITQPMDSIMAVARQIVEGRAYSLRASKTRDDEFGVVIDAFNNMLGEIQVRTGALETSNTALQEAAVVREAAEHAMRASERLYRAIGESINYGVWVCDAQGRNVYASESFLQLTGLTLEEYCSPRWIRVVHPDDRDATALAWKQCVRTGSTWYSEHRIRATDGEYHHVLSQGVPIRGDAGQIDRWAGIHLDIRRLKLSEQALLEADRRKDEFLATLAHELRNPLAPIRSAISILNSGVASAGQLQGARDVIDRQVRHMSRLLDDLLDVSRVTRGTFELKREYVDLKSVCEIAIETALPLIEAKRHALTMDLPSDPVTIETDPVRLAQVISNLLTNAAKYTDPEGQIRLSAVITEAGLALSVADNGIGLSAKSIPHLFSIFSQVDSRTDRAQGGLGIGLALVKGLVELHGGSVEVLSEGLGRGSEFVVRLPSRLVGSRAQRLPETIDAVPLSMQTDALKILVVDDNRDAAETLSLALGFSGYEVVTAFSGPEALAVGARERPRVVILDVGMPGMDGYETVRRLRLEPWGHHALAIALTGWGQEQDKRAARAAGFDEHLTKPIDPARIDEMVARHLAMQRAGAALRLSAVHE